MNNNNASLIISLISMTVSLCAFIWTMIFHFLQRPRLNLLLDKITYKDTGSDKKSDFIRLLMINDGYRPIIISECTFWTIDSGTCYLGIYDTLKAPYGIADIVLPVLIEPAKTAMLNLTHPNNISKITEISVYSSTKKKYNVSQEAIQRMKASVKHDKKRNQYSRQYN